MGSFAVQGDRGKIVPEAPKKPCAAPGCRRLTLARYCSDHERKRENSQRNNRIRYDQERGTATSRGYNFRWSKYSKQYRVEHPLCVMCKAKGILTLAECVDHIEPVNGADDPKFWDESNHQSLCHSCHSEKTAKEDGGFGNGKL